MRHYRAKHNPNSRMYCDAKWSRPYQYRYHLEEHHRDVDPDHVLGKRPGFPWEEHDSPVVWVTYSLCLRSSRDIIASSSDI